MNTRFAVAVGLLGFASAAGCSKCAADDRASATESGVAAQVDSEASAARAPEERSSESVESENRDGDGGMEVATDGARWATHAPDANAEQAWLDVSTIDPACTGALIDLARVIVDPRCATTSSKAKALRAMYEAAPPPALRQEARRAEDGRMEARLVNAGPKPVMLPLSWHPKIPAFIMLADDDKEHAVYELLAPRLEVNVPDAGGARFARIVLPPGGVAVARITMDPTVVSRARGSTPCREAGAPCAPARLAPGRWTLHVGQLVSDVETGEPAVIRWDVP